MCLYLISNHIVTQILQTKESSATQHVPVVLGCLLRLLLLRICAAPQQSADQAVGEQEY